MIRSAIKDLKLPQHYLQTAVSQIRNDGSLKVEEEAILGLIHTLCRTYYNNKEQHQNDIFHV